MPIWPAPALTPCCTHEQRHEKRGAHMRVLIAGGGIGGLSAALCALHFGLEPVVLEQAPVLGEVGAGIQLPPNAMKVFAALGLDAALAEKAFRPTALETRMGRSGRQIFSLPLDQKTETRWGAPYLHIHRADYIAALAAALAAKAPDALRLGAVLTGYRQSATGVTAELADGTEIDGDVLVGADGLHSPVRAQMLGPESPRFTGNIAWRATVPIAHLGDLAPRPTACIWMGPGAHCVTYRLRQGDLANFVGIVERPQWHAESWSAEGSKAQALADFDGWHKTVTQLIEQADSIYQWGLFDRAPLSQWVDGRVALLGDAAHPMLPFMAQGAAMAVEDGFALSAALSAAHLTQMSKSAAIETALAAYQQARFARAGRVQAASRANAKTFHQRACIGQLATYGPMWLAGKIAPMAIHARQDALYGYDITRSV